MTGKEGVKKREAERKMEGEGEEKRKRKLHNSFVCIHYILI